MLPYPVLPWELPEALKLLHPEKKLLVSIRSFPWGIAVRAGPGCGDANRELRSPSSRFWQTFPAPDRQATGKRPARDTRLPGSRGSLEDGPRRRSKPLERRVRFSPIRSAPGGGSPSLHISPYMHRLHQPVLLQPHK